MSLGRVRLLEAQSLERIDVTPIEKKEQHDVAAVETSGAVTEVVNPPEELFGGERGYYRSRETKLFRIV
jgi:hypothetical protein